MEMVDGGLLAGRAGIHVLAQARARLHFWIVQHAVKLASKSQAARNANGAYGIDTVRVLCVILIGRIFFTAWIVLIVITGRTRCVVCLTLESALASTAS